MRFISTLLLLWMTLEIVAQVPKFSFSKQSIEIPSVTFTNDIKVFKGSYTSKNEITNKKAILGNVSFNSDNNSITFNPFVPFQVNTTYTLAFKERYFKFSIPLSKDYQHLKITNIYPNTPTVPTNLLKWYIAFSKPVNPTNIYNHITLIHNKTNTVVDRALLHLETPLLSNDGKLLTLWVEPGRQKRDLGPNTFLGEVLKLGSSYTLIIDKGLKDHQGIAMKNNFEHTFDVGNSDRVKPNFEQWELFLPRFRTKKPLIINLNDTLDYGSIFNNIVITTKKGKIINGSFSIETNKNRIVFTPNKLWEIGDYVLKCNRTIEDICGNNFERLFDRDIMRKNAPLPNLERNFSVQK